MMIQIIHYPQEKCTHRWYWKEYLRSSIRPNIIFTSFTSQSSEKPSNLHRRPYKFPVELNSFLIVIDNHAYTTISKISNHFFGAITTVKGKRINSLGGILEIKGDGNIIWKIEDDDGVIHTIRSRRHCMYLRRHHVC